MNRYTQDVRCLTSLVAVLLLLITAAPVMACVAEAPMAHAQHDCCVTMHGDCGEMAQHGCCGPTLQKQNAQVAATSSALRISCVALSTVDAISLSQQIGVPVGRAAAAEGSPPLLRSAGPLVLRI